MRDAAVRLVQLALLGSTMLNSACGDSSARTGSRAVDSAPLPVSIGSTLPVVRATTLEGASVELGGTAGPTTLVNVWATWCTSCREEMQDLAAIYRDYAPRGLRVVAISVDAGSEALVRRFVQRESLPFAVVHDHTGDIQKRYGIVGVPTSYLVGANGQVVWQQVGGIHGHLPAVRAEVEKVLK